MTSYPADFPTELQREVRLADGRIVVLRPVLPTDLPALEQAIAGADPETLRLRFLGGAPPHDPQTLRRLVEVDYRTRLALVALTADGQGVGIARYESDGRRGSAEVAVAVDPQWRRVGLATALLRLLALAAWQRGIRELTAIYLPGNDVVRRLLRASGLPHEQRTVGDLVEDVVTLQPAVVS